MGLKEFKAAEDARKKQESKTYIQRDLEDQIAEEKTTEKVPEGMNSDTQYEEIDDLSTEGTMQEEFYKEREIKQTNSETSQNTDQMSQTEVAPEAKATTKVGTKDSPINLSQITKMLSDGYTRYKKDDRGIGSVQEKLSLSFAQTKTLFSHPKLKGLKTKHASVLVINDDLPEKVSKDEVFK